MTAYDRFPYPSAPLARTHPHALGGLALEYGLDAPVPLTRVLDIGCGAGRNLTWIAATLPAAECVGVDLAATAIADAQAFAARVDVSNVQFLHADFRSVEGRFDIIIANGLYSWIPEDTRAALLEFIDERLSAQGIAYVSFHEESRPWRAELMQIADPIERLQTAKSRVPELSEFEDGLLLHDALAEISDPISVAQFEAALPEGLTYLCDSRGQAEALTEFHEAVIVRSGRAAGEPLFDKMWFVTESSYPATVADCEDTVLEALSGPRAIVNEAGKYPLAWEPARILARDGDKEIMNYFGALVELEDEDREIFIKLDGTRTCQEFSADTLEFFAKAGLLTA